MNRSTSKPRKKRAHSLPLQTGTGGVAAMETDPETNAPQTAKVDQIVDKVLATVTVGFTTHEVDVKTLSVPVESTDNVAIKVENLTKSYHIYDKPHDSLKQALYPGIQRIFGRPQKRYYREFKALNDVSFEVMKGETVGIIGPNGAGKSTLLQLICGTLSPTSGSLHVNGRITALLELGSGFNPQFSGRENVYISCAILGLSQEEINARYDQIIEFADIGDFIDQPVKTYSSGMTVRLAFATQTALDPQILIVDEALAVGDMSFQIKCYARMNQLKESGTTILFVSHSTGTIQSFCDRAIYLRRGKQLAIGPANEITKQYEQDCLAEKMLPRHGAKKGQQLPNDSNSNADPIAIESRKLADLAWNYRNYYLETSKQGARGGSRTLTIESFILLHEDGTLLESALPTEDVTGCFLVKFNAAFTGDVHFSIQIFNKFGNPLMVVRDSYFEQSISGDIGDTWVGTIRFRMPIMEGIYYCTIPLVIFPEKRKFIEGKFNLGEMEIVDMVEHGAHFRVLPFERHPMPLPVLNESKLNLTRLNNFKPS